MRWARKYLVRIPIMGAGAFFILTTPCFNWSYYLRNSFMPANKPIPRTTNTPRMAQTYFNQLCTAAPRVNEAAGDHAPWFHSDWNFQHASSTLFWILLTKETPHLSSYKWLPSDPLVRRKPKRSWTLSLFAGL